MEPTVSFSKHAGVHFVVQDWVFFSGHRTACHVFLLQEFDGIESEWPMFFAYLLIDSAYKGDQAKMDHYQEKLKSLLLYTDDGSHCLVVDTPRRLAICSSCWKQTVLSVQSPTQG